MTDAEHRVTRCRIVGLEEVYELSFQLARAVRAAGYRPDLVVAIARGGFVPARLVCDFLPCEELTSLTVRHYSAGARREAGARLRQPLAVDVADRRVLVVDDVNASGETLLAARAHVAERGAAELRLGVLHEKPGSRARADFRAAPSDADLWLVYQWALLEDTRGFLQRLDPAPRSEEEARERLASDFGLRLDDADWKRLDNPAPTDIRRCRA